MASSMSVQPLGDGYWEDAAMHLLRGDSVHGDKMAREFAEIDMVGAHRGAVDDPQPQRIAGFDLDHLRIIEGAAIGKKRVILNIV
jgi:hypothetical protein